MKPPLRSLLPLLISSLLSVALAAGALAASPRTAVHSHAPPMDLVTITITSASGTVWGRVTARYTDRHHTTVRSCSAASCTLRIPQGVTVHLSQTARDTATWPFKNWQLSAHQRMQTMTASAIAVKVTGSMSVTAVYVLTPSQPSSGGYRTMISRPSVT